MVNPYFNFTTSNNEQNLVEDLVIESIQIYGMDIQYIPTTFVDYSKLFGEDPQRAFLSSYTIEAYFENVEGFMGDKNFLNKLGLNIDKQATFIISKRRFDEEVLGINWKDDWDPTITYSLNDAVRYQGVGPVPGIYINRVDGNVNNVPGTDFLTLAIEDTTNLVSLTLNYVSGVFDPEDIIVGQTSNALATVISFDGTILILQPTTNTGSFIIGEVILDSSTTQLNTVATGTITAIDPYVIANSFRPGDILSGAVSNASAVVVSFNSYTNVLQITNARGLFLYGENLLNITNGAKAEILNVIMIPNISPSNWKVMDQVSPGKGGLIYLPVTHDLFEILFADHEEVFYQLGKIYVWKITCEKYRFSHEKIDTGILDIDSIAKKLENNDSVENDPLADNEVVERRVEDFLNLDSKAPF